LVNRVVSCIDAYRVIKAAGKKAQSMTEFGDYKFSLSSHPLG